MQRSWRSLAAVVTATMMPALLPAIATTDLGTPVTGPSASHRSSLTGPWGELEITPIVISPPLEYLPRDLAPPRAPQWIFPGRTRDSVAATLREAGLPDGDIARLLAGAHADEDGDGIVLLPDPALVLGLPMDVRAPLYAELGKSPLNQAQDLAFRYKGETADDWLGGTPIADRTRALVDRLIYRDGRFLFFADFDLVRRTIGDTDELQRLHKRLLRQKTLIVNLRIDDAADLDRVIEYWGRGGRRTDIRPLLESIAAGGAGSAIDISHLLPTLARQHLYRYPRATLDVPTRPVLATALWTALNFFNTKPDDRYLDATVALDALKEDYYFIEDNYQLGDIVALTDSSGTIFHAAVYLAGGLIFGKNGATPLAPWSILPLDDLDGHYAEERARGWTLSYLRRKDL
jgi:hypothetical protein